VDEGFGVLLSPEEDDLWLSRVRVRDFLLPGFPLITCLCGSTRFADAYARAQREETLAGRIVLTVGLFGHQEALDMGGPVKSMLDQLHLRKIDLADEVLVLNVGGYVGESTRREIEYARKRGKALRYLEPPEEDCHE
jgi:hypothetical protein